MKNAYNHSKCLFSYYSTYIILYSMYYLNYFKQIRKEHAVTKVTLNFNVIFLNADLPSFGTLGSVLLNARRMLVLASSDSSVYFLLSAVLRTAYINL